MTITNFKKLNFIQVFFTIHLLFVGNSLFAQNENYKNYYEHIIKAETLFFQNQYESAIKEYDKAFLSAYAFPYDVIKAIIVHQKLKNQDQINDLLNLLVKSGFKPNNEIFVYIEEDNQYFKHLKPTHISIPEYRDKLDSIYNLQINNNLRKIDVVKDNYLSAFKTFEFFVTYSRKFANIDEDESKSIYLQEVLWRSTKDLFLNLYHSGQDISRQNTDTWNDELFINCLIHTAQTFDYKKKEFQDFLLQMVKQGNLHPYQYAVIVDDVERRSGNQQIYGTITDPIEFDGDIEKYRNTEKQIYKIEDIENVDKRRNEIFLPPLWVSAKKYKYKLPENYKAK